MKVLGWIMASLGGLGILFGVGTGLALLSGSGPGGAVLTFLGLFFLSILPIAAGVGLALWGRYFVRSANRERAMRLERQVRDLAARHGGAFTLGQAAESFALTRDEMDLELRPLVGRQVLEIDFLSDGEVTYKLSPLAESRARLGR